MHGEGTMSMMKMPTMLLLLLLLLLLTMIDFWFEATSNGSAGGDYHHRGNAGTGGRLEHMPVHAHGAIDMQQL